MPSKNILLLANAAWNLWNYRSALIERLAAAGYTVLLAAPEDGYEKQLIQNHPDARFFPVKQFSRRSFSPFQNLATLLEFYRLFRRERPDLILLFTIKPNILGNLAARMTRVSTVSIVEGLGYSGTHAARWRWLAAPLLRLALKGADKVVFLNRDDARDFERSRIVRLGQGLVIPGPGINLSHFQICTNAPENAQLVFLYCGRLLKEKGVLEFLDAARHIRLQAVPANFQVLGSPDPGNPSSISTHQLEKFKREMPVQFLGSTDDVRPYLEQADVLVLPSYYREGVPRSVLEAMALEKIIVTTDTPGCRDTVDESKNGFLVPPRDTKALVSASLRIIQLSPEARRQMGRYSREKVSREFSDDRVLPQYMRLIDGLLKPK